MSTKSVVIGVTLFAAGIGAGYGVGYFISKKRVELTIQKEVDTFKAEYDPFKKQGIFATVEGAVDALIPDDEQTLLLAKQAEDIQKSSGYGVIIDEPQDALAEEFNEVVEAAMEQHNVWDDHGETVADEDIIAAAQAVTDALNKTNIPEEVPEEVPEDEKIFPRDPDHPYIISEHQFMHDGMHSENKEELLYFEGDETLVDDAQTLIPDVEYLVGIVNLHHFGRGARGNDTLYIRNEKTGADYEVIRDKRNFTEVVLGIKPAKSGPLRMRNDDQ